MTLTDFLKTQLQATFDALQYATTIYPETNTHTPPFDDWTKQLWPQNELGGRYMGTWSRHRLLFHLVYYEQHYVLSHLKLWTSGVDDINQLEEGEMLKNINGTMEEMDYEEISQSETTEMLVNQLENLRKRQIQTLQTLTDEVVKTKKKTEWGERSLEWVLGKSIQHSFEHGNKMLRHALFWEMTQKSFPTWVERHKQNGGTIDPALEQEIKEYVV